MSENFNDQVKSDIVSSAAYMIVPISNGNMSEVF